MKNGIDIYHTEYSFIPPANTYCFKYISGTVARPKGYKTKTTQSQAWSFKFSEGYRTQNNQNIL